MPWKECSVMDERLQFVARRLAGEPMAELCREFGISRICRRTILPFPVRPNSLCFQRLWGICISWLSISPGFYAI